MEKTHAPVDSAPPYPGPPLAYGATPPGYSGPQAGYPGPQAGYPGPQAGYPGPQAGYPAPQAGYPAPQAGYQGGGSPPVQQVTVTQVLVQPNLQSIPAHTVCPYCQQGVVTNTMPETGLLTWAVCGGLALLGCCLCCWIPFCVDSLQDVKHICPNCKKVIHLHKRM